MINGLLNQTITIYNKSSLDAYGRESYSAGASEHARVEVGNKNYLKPNGETIVIDATAFVKNTATISIDDKILWSAVYYKVIYLNKIVDGQGNLDHYELGLQQWGAQS
jgi:hypothetical protein